MPLAVVAWSFLQSTIKLKGARSGYVHPVKKGTGSRIVQATPTSRGPRRRHVLYVAIDAKRPEEMELRLVVLV